MKEVDGYSIQEWNDDDDDNCGGGHHCEHDLNMFWSELGYHRWFSADLLTSNCNLKCCTIMRHLGRKIQSFDFKCLCWRKRLMIKLMLSVIQRRLLWLAWSWEEVDGRADTSNQLWWRVMRLKLWVLRRHLNACTFTTMKCLLLSIVHFVSVFFNLPPQWREQLRWFYLSR